MCSRHYCKCLENIKVYILFILQMVKDKHSRHQQLKRWKQVSFSHYRLQGKNWVPFWLVQRWQVKQRDQASRKGACGELGVQVKNHQGWVSADQTGRLSQNFTSMGAILPSESISRERLSGPWEKTPVGCGRYPSASKGQREGSQLQAFLVSALEGD